jgi:hypothetical protein
MRRVCYSALDWFKDFPIQAICYKSDAFALARWHRFFLSGIRNIPQVFCAAGETMR